MIGELRSVDVPIVDLPKICVLDGVRVSNFAIDESIAGHRSVAGLRYVDTEVAESASQSLGYPMALVRLDGVAYLMQGAWDARLPGLLVLRRVPEGPLIQDIVADYVVSGGAAFPSMRPLVCSVVRRPPRLDADVAGSILSGRTLPLPDRMDETSDRLCLTDEETGLLILEAGFEWCRPPQTSSRVVLPMGSGVNILPGTSTQITARPQNGAFRIDRLIIGGTPSDWIVHDVRIGNRSQFNQSGDIPGDIFSAGSIDSFVSFGVASVAQDVVLLVTYVGQAQEGAPFVGAFLGQLVHAELRRRLVVRWTPQGRRQGWMMGLLGEDENRDFDPGMTLDRAIRQATEQLAVRASSAPESLASPHVLEPAGERSGRAR